MELNSSEIQLEFTSTKTIASLMTKSTNTFSLGLSNDNQLVITILVLVKPVFRQCWMNPNIDGGKQAKNKKKTYSTNAITTAILKPEGIIMHIYMHWYVVLMRLSSEVVFRDFNIRNFPLELIYHLVIVID